jgi:hypothetical protein
VRSPTPRGVAVCDPPWAGTPPRPSSPRAGHPGRLGDELLRTTLSGGAARAAGVRYSDAELGLRQRSLLHSSRLVYMVHIYAAYAAHTRLFLGSTWGISTRGWLRTHPAACIPDRAVDARAQ